jgi:subtilisin family serine protease
LSRSRRIAATAALLAAGALAPSASAAEHVPGQVIVKFDDGTSLARQSAALAHAGAVDTLGRLRGIGAKLVRVTGDPGEAAATLRESAAVEYAETNKILTASSTPNDPLFGDQWGLATIGAPRGWDGAGLGGFPSTGGAKVGVIDTGIDRSHPEFAGRISNCVESTSLLLMNNGIKAGCDDEDGHGTQVAGILAATANNGAGVAGVAFNSPIGVCRALEDGLARGATSNVVNCLDWLRAKGAKVISMSFGGPSSTALYDAIKRAWNSGGGAVLVAAAGNDGGYGTLYPAGYPQVVSVAATDQLDAWAGSNRNADVEVAAPGVDILSTALGDGYTSGSGTSSAAPFAAGVAAVLRQKYPTETAAQTRTRLDSATVDLGALGRDSTFGFGRVSLCLATGAC